ncbi:hypothetical protein [Shewanella algae]|uniref:hypothetical protein n=1 Tax=Shewanella algae TaxID=38313 RepID=UPI0031F572A9
MFKKKLIALVVSCALTSPALAFTSTGTDLQMLATLMEQLDNAKEQLGQLKDFQKQYQEFQRAFDEIERLQKIAEQASNAVRQGDINGALRGIKYKLSTVSGLVGVELPSDINELRKVIDEALYGESDPANIAILEQEKSFLEVQETLMALRDASNENLERMSKDESINESHRINATNTSILARIAVENQASEVSKQSKEAQAKIDAVNDTFKTGKLYKKLSED